MTAPTYHMPIPDRKAWTKIRDDLHVPSGASKKADIGPKIEAVHKSFSPTTISKNLKDTEELLADLDTYLNDIKTKYPKAVDPIKKQVRSKVSQHKAFLSDIVKARTEYHPRYTQAQAKYDEVVAGTAQPKDAAKAFERLLGCLAAFTMIDGHTWNGRRQALNKLMGEMEKAHLPLAPDLKRHADIVLVDLRGAAGH